MKKEEKKDIKKIKNILSDDISKDNKDFDILFIVDATGSMSPYIVAAKEETKNISDELEKLYPDKMFNYGYIFYRDPIDSKSDKHEVIDLTDNVNSFPEKIARIQAEGGGDIPEDWAGAYKLANEKISWRNGLKTIIHLTDAGAHGKLFTLNDKYPEEEQKLIIELDKCAEKGIKIFGYVINDRARESFNQCSKIYRSKGGSFEIFDFIKIESKPDYLGMPSEPYCRKSPIMFGTSGMGGMNPGMFGSTSMGGMSPGIGGSHFPNQMMNMNRMNMNMNMMNMNMNMMNNSAPMPPMMNHQMAINMNFQRNAITNIQSILDKPK